MLGQLTVLHQVSKIPTCISRGGGPTFMGREGKREKKRRKG